MGYVYFISSIRAIKIGFATNVKTRMRELQTSHHEKLDLIGFVAGEMELEKSLHSKFADKRLVGEWFEPCSEIYEYIKNHSLGNDFEPYVQKAIEEKKKLKKLYRRNLGIDYLVENEMLSEFQAHSLRNLAFHFVQSMYFSLTCARDTYLEIEKRISDFSEKFENDDYFKFASKQMRSDLRSSINASFDIRSSWQTTDKALTDEQISLTILSKIESALRQSNSSCPDSRFVFAFELAVKEHLETFHKIHNRSFSSEERKAGTDNA